MNIFYLLSTSIRANFAAPIDGLGDVMDDRLAATT